jgi:membrane-bound lytic murein transglycosylase D
MHPLQDKAAKKRPGAFIEAETSQSVASSRTHLAGERLVESEPLIGTLYVERAPEEPPFPVPVRAEETKSPQQVLDEALEYCRTSQDYWVQGDFENAIASLDRAYSLTLKAETKEDSKLVQQKEDIRFLICKRVLEIYASRHTVVNGNHNAIPMVMNRHVQKEIERFKGPARTSFIKAYKRSGRYRAGMLEVLREAGLPEELSWLPLIESGFKVKALSQARALGLWQFIPSTGYKFGLRRNQWVDERMDVRKSTLAAAAYLQELHKIFGDWCTVLAAYNCGEARVLKVIRSQNINYLDNFWDLYDRLPWETARYVPRFLAALHIINDPKAFNFDLPSPQVPIACDMVSVSVQLRLSDIARTLHISSEIIEDLNPELRYKVTPPESYMLKVPKGQGAVLTAKLEEIPIYTALRASYAHHVVRRGETLSDLASRYSTSVGGIMRANNLQIKDYIRVGQQLKIPMKGSGGLGYGMVISTEDYVAVKPLHYRVKGGDSLWLLARRYNTSIEDIVDLNRLNTRRLHIGQELIIPRDSRRAGTHERTRAYRVKSGDSPYRIAMQHEMELERFLSLNDLTPRSKIYPGQIFLVDEE